jgi:hypothetical protein
VKTQWQPGRDQSWRCGVERAVTTADHDPIYLVHMAADQLRELAGIVARAAQDSHVCALERMSNHFGGSCTASAVRVDDQKRATLHARASLTGCRTASAATSCSTASWINAGAPSLATDRRFSRPERTGRRRFF